MSQMYLKASNVPMFVKRMLMWLLDKFWIDRVLAPPIIVSAGASKEQLEEYRQLVEDTLAWISTALRREAASLLTRTMSPSVAGRLSGGDIREMAPPS